jgi:hypothetical protein
MMPKLTAPGSEAKLPLRKTPPAPYPEEKPAPLRIFGKDRAVDVKDNRYFINYFSCRGWCGILFRIFEQTGLQAETTSLVPKFKTTIFACSNFPESFSRY